MINASVLLNVTYKPKILCDGVLASIMGIRVNQTDVKINCRVSANPPIPDPSQTDDTITWLDGGCASTKKIVDNTEYSTYEAAISSNKKSRTIGLTFRQKITKSYIGKSYCLRVRNENGHTDQTITFQEARLGAASMITSGSLTYLVGLFLAATTLRNRN